MEGKYLKIVSVLEGKKAASSYRWGWCSWCFRRTRHRLIEKNRFKRNTYKCENCGNHTVRCLVCENMARDYYEVYGKEVSDNKKFTIDVEKLALCAEHEGSIVDFNRVSGIELEDLEEYNRVFMVEEKKLRVSRKAIVKVIAVADLAGFLYYLTKRKNREESKYQNRDDSFKKNSYIEIAKKAGQIIVISCPIYKLAEGLLGKIENFSIKKVKGGRGPSLVFIDGFLTESKEHCSDWIESVRERYPENPYYWVKWESSDKIQFSAESLSGKIELLPLDSLLVWYSIMIRAQKTGKLLADIIARTRNNDGFILMGHSLGARVIYYTLRELSFRNKPLINDVFLLGGAVDRKDEIGWETAIKSVRGKIINCYSEDDNVLGYLYKGSMLGLSDPVGIGRIELCDERIVNLNKTDLVKEHTAWKNKFGDILKSLQTSG